MPTIAGGIHVGELYAFCTLLGPPVAYFLGGAVSLHKDGPIEGAKLCTQVIDAAIDIVRNEKPKRTEGRKLPELKNNLIEKIESAYLLDRYYISPRGGLFSVEGLNPFWNHD